MITAHEWASETLTNQLKGFSVQSMLYASTAHFINDCTDSRLSTAVQEFLAFIIDELFALGIPSDKSVQKAFAFIEAIQARIKNGETDEGPIRRTSEEFYQLIPFKGYQFRRPALTTRALCCRQIVYMQKFEQHLTALLAARRSNNNNPFDNFVSDWLKVNITALDRRTPEFGVLAKVVTNTQHSHTHFCIDQIFKIDGTRSFTTDITDNHRYLLHFSFPYNFLGILREGLLVSPEHVSNIDRPMGKGIYFWNAIANAGVPHYSLNTVHVLVCRVALGRVKEFPTGHTQRDEDAIVQLDGYDSGFQPGRLCTGTRTEDATLNDAKIYCGKIEDWTDECDVRSAYDNYILSNENQVKVEYVLKLDRVRRNAKRELSDPPNTEVKIAKRSPV